MGELHARPGISICQAMFSSGPQRSGSAGSSATTPATPPRNWGQFVWADTPAAIAATSTAVTVTRVVFTAAS